LVKDGLYRVSGVGARDYGPEGRGIAFQKP
jgi:hypothetical protein